MYSSLLDRRKVLLALTAMTLSGKAVSNPSDVVRLVVPFTPGGASDVLARLVATHMSAAGQTTIVENKPGAGGILAVRSLLQLPADGRTLLFTPASPVTANPSLYRELPYEPLKDLVPVARMFRAPPVLISTTARPFQTFSELKAASDQGTPLNFASGSSGYTLLFTQVSKDTGLRATVVNYKGASAALQDVVAGTADFTIVDPSLAYQLIKAERVRALAIFDEKRDVNLPSVKTSVEAGAGKPTLYQWISVFAKSGTPKETLTRIEQHLRNALADKHILATASGMGVTAFWGDAAATRAHAMAETEMIRTLAKEARIELQ